MAVRDRPEKVSQAVLRRYNRLCRNYHDVLESKMSAEEWITEARRVLLSMDRAINGLRELAYRPKLSDDRAVASRWRYRLAVVERDLVDMLRDLQMTEPS